MGELLYPPQGHQLPEFLIRPGLEQIQLPGGGGEGSLLDLSTQY